jgi:hypothetical protein
LDLLRWNFTEMITGIDRCVSNVKKFQNGCRCHGNHKTVYISLIIPSRNLLRRGYSIATVRVCVCVFVCSLVSSSWWAAYGQDLKRTFALSIFKLYILMWHYKRTNPIHFQVNRWNISWIIAFFLTWNSEMAHII